MKETVKKSGKGSMNIEILSPLVKSVTTLLNNGKLLVLLHSVCVAFSITNPHLLFTLPLDTDIYAPPFAFCTS